MNKADNITNNNNLENNCEHIANDSVNNTLDNAGPEEVEGEKYNGRINYTQAKGGLKSSFYEGDYIIKNDKRVPDGKGFLVEQGENHKFSFDGNFIAGNFTNGTIFGTKSNIKFEAKGEFKPDSSVPYNGSYTLIQENANIISATYEKRNGMTLSTTIIKSDGSIIKGDIKENLEYNKSKELNTKIDVLLKQQAGKDLNLQRVNNKKGNIHYYELINTSKNNTIATIKDLLASLENSKSQYENASTIDDIISTISDLKNVITLASSINIKDLPKLKEIVDLSLISIDSENLKNIIGGAYLTKFISEMNKFSIILGDRISNYNNLQKLVEKDNETFPDWPASKINYKINRLKERYAQNNKDMNENLVWLVKLTQEDTNQAISDLTTTISSNVNASSKDDSLIKRVVQTLQNLGDLTSLAPSMNTEFLIELKDIIDQTITLISENKLVYTIDIDYGTELVPQLKKFSEILGQKIIEDKDVEENIQNKDTENINNSSSNLEAKEEVLLADLDKTYKITSFVSNALEELIVASGSNNKIGREIIDKLNNFKSSIGNSGKLENNDLSILLIKIEEIQELMYIAQLQKKIVSDYGKLLFPQLDSLKFEIKKQLNT